MLKSRNIIRVLFDAWDFPTLTPVEAVLDGQVHGKSGKVEYMLVVNSLVVHASASRGLGVYGGRSIYEQGTDCHL